jgi:hypothetical protein
LNDGDTGKKADDAALIVPDEEDEEVGDMLGDAKGEET